MRAPRMFRGLPREFWVQWWGTLLNRLATFVQPFLVLYLTTSRGLSVPQAGMVAAVWGAGVIAGAVVGGWSADRVGPRATVLGGMCLSAAALVGLGAARGLPLLLVAALLAGVTSNIYRPAADALVADIVAPADRTRAFGLTFWAINAGFSVSAALGGYLASLGYGLLFAVDAATCLACGVLVYVGLPEPPPTARPTRRSGGYRMVFSDTNVVALLLLTAGYALVYEQAYVALPLAVRDADLPTSAYGAVIAVNGVFIILFQPWISSVVGRYPRGRVMAAATLLLGTGLACTGLADTVWEFGATVVLWSVGESAMAGNTQAVVTDLSSPEARGAYQGAFTMARSCSMLFGPMIGAAVYAGPGPGVLWGGVLVAGVLVAAGFPLVVRRAKAATLPEAANRVGVAGG
ncbi:MFS transporter [Streptomyces sp. BR1]|uniref:MFS transporter n=1 Tax=Streptomyces sp. BR1 TaxID=1592323 RepID=UPI00402BC379